MTFSWGMINILILCSFTCPVIADGETRIASRKYHSEIYQDLQNGRYEEVYQLAGEWAAQQEVNEYHMMYSVKYLCEKKQYSAAIVLLKRLKWKRPFLFWGAGFIKYLEKKGMNRELDLFLTYRTALDDREYHREDASLNKIVRIYPHQADILFRYYNDRGRRKKLFKRYEEELKNRPNDAVLLAEYAYFIAKYDIPKAIELVNRIDLNKINKLSLVGLGRMWSFLSDKRLLNFSVKPLEVALKKKSPKQNTYLFNKQKPDLYYECQQVIYSSHKEAVETVKRGLMEDLALRYLKLERYNDAKAMCEQLLVLPPERFDNRVGIQKTLAEANKGLGIDDSFTDTLKDKAEKSGEAKDWAELAGYLQGQKEYDDARDAWLKAIARSSQIKGKGGSERDIYLWQLIRMLDAAEMYDDEIDVLKDALKGEMNQYSRISFIDKIVKLQKKTGDQDESFDFLVEQLDKKFDVDIVFMILLVTNSRDKLDRFPMSIDQAKELSSWELVIKRINHLKEPDRSYALAKLYNHLNIHYEYYKLINSLPPDSLNWRLISGMIDACHHFGEYSEAVKWSKLALTHTGQDGYFTKGSAEYVSVLRGIVSNSVLAGNFETGKEYALSACIYNQDNFNYIKNLAKLAIKMKRQNELVAAFEKVSLKYPERWSVWQCLALVYGEFGQNEKVAECLKKVDALK